MNYHRERQSLPFRKGERMSSKIERSVLVLALIIMGFASPLLGQQKGQWVPGQFGLNAGVIPEPGITYANMPLNYSAGRLNDSNGNRVFQNVTGTYAFWVDENIFFYVPKQKFLGGYYMPYMALSYASGSVVADLSLWRVAMNKSSVWSPCGFSRHFFRPNMLPTTFLVLA